MIIKSVLARLAIVESIPRKILVGLVALAIFLAVVFTPWYLSDIALARATHPDYLSWALGLSMIIWLPLSIFLHGWPLISL